MSLACKQSAPDESSLNGSTVAISEGVVVELNERLAQVSVPYLTSQNQIHLANIVECVALAEKHRRSMDQNAMRFYVFFRQHILLKARRSARSQGVTWREIAWAQHSNSQDILVDLVAKNYQSRILWNHAKETGMFMWLIDIDTLVAHSSTHSYETRPNILIANPIRDHGSQRVYKEGREEPHRL